MVFRKEIGQDIRIWLDGRRTTQLDGERTIRTQNDCMPAHKGLAYEGPSHKGPVGKGWALKGSAQVPTRTFFFFPTALSSLSALKLLNQ